MSKPKVLNPDQLAAIKEYAEKVGRNWKDQLWIDWSRAGSREVSVDTYSILHGIRNRFGPSWLASFSLSKAIEAAKNSAGRADVVRAFNVAIAALRNVGLDGVADRLETEKELEVGGA